MESVATAVYSQESAFLNHRRDLLLHRLSLNADSYGLKGYGFEGSFHSLSFLSFY